MVSAERSAQVALSARNYAACSFVVAARAAAVALSAALGNVAAAVQVLRPVPPRRFRAALGIGAGLWRI